MKKIKLLTLFAALLCAVGAWAWSGSGTAADPYLISSAAHWNTLASNSASNTYSGKYFKLTADISVNTMVGTDGSRFAGIFDGNGHTLEFIKGTSGSPYSAEACAPFSFICGATIKRLHVTGIIHTSNQFAGMVGRARGTGTCSIIRCRSSLNIYASRDGDGTHGGILGLINDGAYVSISNCLFDGTLDGPSTNNCGGLVGWSGGARSSISNCLFAPANGDFYFSTSGSNTISRNGGNMDIANCYCTVEVNFDNQATVASGMSNDQLLAALGSGWTISGSNVVPAIVGTPIVGAVAKVDDFYYTSFADALAEWTGGATLTLLADIAYASPITVDGKIVVLDLNGHGIRHTGTEGVFCIVHGADFTLNDSDPDTEHRFSIDDENGFATLDEANGSLTIHGGYITGGIGCGNTAYLNPGYKDGGAFFLYYNATMTMNGGTLIGNGEAINNNRTGGAVFITRGSHFIMNGGTITRNKARYGGGISLYGSTTADISINAPSVLEIHGGEISYNYATGNSGGVHTNARSCNETVYITGGSIINNRVPEGQNAAGMYVEHTGTTVHMSGNPVIKDNYSGSVQKGLQLTNNATLRFDGDMTNTEPIHIYMMATDVPFTNGLGTHADASNFVSDNPTYGVKINSSGEAIMAQAAGISAHPAAINTTYTGVAQTLVTAGTAINGTMAYSLDRITWSASTPQATNAGNYTVYYRVVGDDTHGDIEPNPNSVEVTIAKAASVITVVPTAKIGLVYTGAPLTLIQAGEATGGEMQYSLDNSNWSTNLPTGTDASDYTVYYRVVGDANHTDIDAASLNVTIAAPAAVIGDPNTADEITAFLDYYNGQNVAALTIERPVLNNMYNTLCLPFDMDEDQIAASSLNGIEIYELEDVSVVNDELYLYTGAQENAIVAGRPYLVKLNADSRLDELDFENITIRYADLNEGAVTIKGVTFTGTFQPVVLGAQTELDFNGGHLFLGQNNQLFWPNTNNPVKPFRAYFTVNVDAGQAAGMPMRRGMPAHIGQPAQMPTGVESIQPSAVSSQKVMIDGVLYIIRGEHMYDAQGQIVK